MMEIQEFIKRFKHTFVYELLLETLTDEQLFEHVIDKDGAVIWFKEQTRQMWFMWQAAKAHALQEKLQGVVLTCNQLKEALEYGAPDLFSKTQGQESDIEFQLGTEMAIEYTKDGHSGSGYYCWYSDLPEEGSILLGTEFVAQEQGQAAPDKDHQVWATVDLTWMDIAFRALSCKVLKSTENWVHVKNIACVGSTTASLICKKLGVDPAGTKFEKQEIANG